MNFHLWIKSDELDRDSCNQVIHGWNGWHPRMDDFSKTWHHEGTSFLKSQNNLLKVDQEKRTRRDFRFRVNGYPMFYEIFSEKK